ncbi:MAG: phage recombination protein Bet [Ilumatobacteraceae bacterium]
MTTTLAKTEPKPKEQIIEFVPIGESDAIKLSKSIVTRYVSNPTKSGAQPADRDVVQFLALCKARRLNPFVGDAYLIGYDSKDGPVFSLITSIAALLKRAELSGQLDGIESGVMVEDSDGVVTERAGHFVPSRCQIVGGWAKVYRKDRKMPHAVTIPLAGYQKPTAIWREQPGLMIAKCAKAAALREAFPSETSGMYVEEETSKERAVIGREVPTDDPMTAGVSKPAPALELTNDLTPRERLDAEAKRQGLPPEALMVDAAEAGLVQEKLMADYTDAEILKVLG